MDTHDAGFRQRFARIAAQREAELRQALAQAGVDTLELSTDGDLVDAIVRVSLLGAGLRDRLISGRAVEETVRAFAEEMNRLNRARRAEGEQDRRALDKIEKAIAGIIAAIEDGMYQPSMKARMDELERQKAEIVTRQLQVPPDTPDVHPNIASIYHKRVERFTDALHDDDDGRIAAEELRSLIEEVVLLPGEKRGEVHAKRRQLG